MYLTLNPNKDKLVAQFDYNQSYNLRIHGIPGARWSRIEKSWILPKDLETMKQFKMIFPWATILQDVRTWELGMLRQMNLNLEHKKHTDYLDHDWSDFPFKLKPYAHQIKALDLLYSNKNFALAADMGTGKTACMINLIQKIKWDGEARPVLVVAPLSVIGVWQQEVAKFGNDLRCVKLVGSKYEREQALAQMADIYVINYEGLRIIFDQLNAMEWSMIVCDESQKIKNRTTIQSKCCFKLGQKAARRYIVSGTLIVNNPLDLFGQFKFLDQSILGSNFYGFQNHFALMVTNGRARFPVKFINLEELAAKINPWSYRVTKKECLDLPEKIYETRYVSLSPKARKIYKTLANELMAELDSGARVTAQIVLTKLLRFSQITAGFVTTEDGEVEELENETKINELESIIQEAGDQQIVCWVKFRHEMEMVRRRLAKLGISHGCLGGATPQKDREKLIQSFSEGKVKVFIGQIEAGGLGITLTTASVCVYLSNSYSLGTRLQSEDRLHRISQKNNVTYIDIICYDTIDEKVIELIKKKQNMSDIINSGIDIKSFVGGV